jgi:uncharacterized protein YacL
MNYLPLHIFFMATALASMLVGISTAHFLKTKKWWLKAHKSLNLIAAASLVFGAITAFLMVQSSGGPHFRVPHAFLGITAIVASIAMPALGFSIFKAKGKEIISGRKRLHRWAGRGVSLALGLTALSGLVLAGIL